VIIKQKDFKNNGAQIAPCQFLDCISLHQSANFIFIQDLGIKHREVWQEQNIPFLK
jgi:hypothetical protein